jgi:hypothetical protein
MLLGYDSAAKCIAAIVKAHAAEHGGLQLLQYAATAAAGCCSCCSVVQQRTLHATGALDGQQSAGHPAQHLL